MPNGKKAWSNFSDVFSVRFLVVPPFLFGPLPPSFFLLLLHFLLSWRRRRRRKGERRELEEGILAAPLWSSHVCLYGFLAQEEKGEREREREKGSGAGERLRPQQQQQQKNERERKQSEKKLPKKCFPPAGVRPRPRPPRGRPPLPRPRPPRRQGPLRGLTQQPPEETLSSLGAPLTGGGAFSCAVRVSAAGCQVPLAAVPLPLPLPLPLRPPRRYFLGAPFVRRRSGDWMSGPLSLSLLPGHPGRRGRNRGRGLLGAASFLLVPPRPDSKVSLVRPDRSEGRSSKEPSPP